MHYRLPASSVRIRQSRRAAPSHLAIPERRDDQQSETDDLHRAAVIHDHHPADEQRTDARKNEGTETPKRANVHTHGEHGDSGEHDDDCRPGAFMNRQGGAGQRENRDKGKGPVAGHDGKNDSGPRITAQSLQGVGLLIHDFDPDPGGASEKQCTQQWDSLSSRRAVVSALWGRLLSKAR